LITNLASYSRKGLDLRGLQKAITYMMPSLKRLSKLADLSLLRRVSATAA
jgi:hypothetical protein